eukprot:765960-Hanusia_phi.AAC.7
MLGCQVVVDREDRSFQCLSPVAQVDLVGGGALCDEASSVEVEDEEGRRWLQVLRVPPAEAQRAPALHLLALEAPEGDEPGLDSRGRDVVFPAEHATFLLRRGDRDVDLLRAVPLPHGDRHSSVNRHLPAYLYVGSHHGRKPLGDRQLRQIPEGLDEVDVGGAVLLRDPPPLLHRLHEEPDAMVVRACQLREQVIAVVLLVAPAVGGGGKEDHPQEVLQAGGILVAVHVAVEDGEVDVAELLHRRLQRDVREEQASLRSC